MQVGCKTEGLALELPSRSVKVKQSYSLTSPKHKPFKHVGRSVISLCSTGLNPEDAWRQLNEKQHEQYMFHMYMLCMLVYQTTGI